MSVGIAPVYGPPKIGSVQTANFRKVFRGPAPTMDLSGGKLINGTYSRDPGNSPDVGVLRAGLLMGKRSSDSQYAPSIIGTTTVASSSGTSLTVGAATAVAIVRRIGATGTFKLVGPPAAAGAVQVQTVTYSAVNTTTGVITITALAAASISGSFVCPTDGSEDMITFIPDGYGIVVIDNDGTTNLTAPFPCVPIEAEVVSSQIVNWPSDTSLQAFIKSKMSASGVGQFFFDDSY